MMMIAVMIVVVTDVTMEMKCKIFCHNTYDMDIMVL